LESPVIGLKEIKEAAERIEPHAHITPVLTCSTLDGMTGAELFFKCENFQKVGAFKFRGALNAVLFLSDEEAAKGVVTASSGNHAAALALAAGIRDIPVTVVMPENAPDIKKAAVAGYGAEIVFCDPDPEARVAKLEEVAAETGAVLIHAYNDLRVIAGQGTACLELMDQVRDLDVVITPVGGGGLLSGTALAAKGLNLDIKVLAGEPAGADDAFRSLQEHRIVPSINPRTIADGLLTSLGDLTFPIIREKVDRIVPVGEDRIVAAMRLIWERMKIIVEPSAAVGLAAVFKAGGELAGKRVGIILSGGNLDLESLPWSA